MLPRTPTFAAIYCMIAIPSLRADVGDPQLGTDHPWYAGELSCSTFERLFATQAALYQREIGVKPTTDEQKALASWYWRNTHYWHGEEGAEDLWGQGLNKGADRKTREYWTGLFAHGFALCGTTHAQWVAEMEALFGHNRGRAVGTEGHNSFEVFLKGGAYGAGKWALLDHDVSTVIYDKGGSGLLSIREVSQNWKQLTDRKNQPLKQHGWLVCGLHPSDGGVYAAYRTAEYAAGYSGPPPVVHLRRGETLRRYLQPGLEDGKTYVFWGRNYNLAGIPGPERAHTWVNQPEKMHNSTNGAGFIRGQARFGNAVYTYTPNFANADYREGVIEEDNQHVVFEFYTPYIIAATPPNDKPWGIYDDGGRNGLVLHGKATCGVSVSTDQGKTWFDAGKFADGLDLTDQVKGKRQYFLKLNAGAKELEKAGLSWVTVCQANTSVMPRLKDGGSEVRLESSRRAVLSAGPNLPQAEAHLVDGKFNGPSVTLELKSPRGEPIQEIAAAAHVASGNPPRAEVKYQIDVSTDGGKTWKPAVKDWTLSRQGEEPKDFWSQSLCWGSLKLAESTSNVRVRFSNSGNRANLRAEAHAIYRTPEADPTKATFSWKDDGGAKQASNVFKGAAIWKVPTGKNVETRWVEIEAAPAR
jgi:hypothetical protein